MVVVARTLNCTLGVAPRSGRDMGTLMTASFEGFHEAILDCRGEFETIKNNHVSFSGGVGGGKSEGMLLRI